MEKRLIYGLVLAGLLVLGYLGYANWRQDRAMLSGEVTGIPPESAVPEQSAPLPEVRPPAVAPSPKPQLSAPVNAPASAPVNAPAYHPADPPADTPVAMPAAAGPPASDTMAPNPPNGLAYAGSGRFQVYRQGNLTYRIDTETGRSCVLYATNEEWRKPQVYTHGCGNSAGR